MSPQEAEAEVRALDREFAALVARGDQEKSAIAHHSDNFRAVIWRLIEVRMRLEEIADQLGER